MVGEIESVDHLNLLIVFNIDVTTSVDMQSIIDRVINQKVKKTTDETEILSQTGKWIVLIHFFITSVFVFRLDYCNHLDLIHCSFGYC